MLEPELEVEAGLVQAVRLPVLIGPQQLLLSSTVGYAANCCFVIM